MLIVLTHVPVCFPSGLLWIPCHPSLVDPSLHRASPALTLQTARRIMWQWWVLVSGGETAHCSFCFNELLPSEYTLCEWNHSVLISRTQCLPPQLWVAPAAQPPENVATWTILHWTSSLDHPAHIERYVGLRAAWASKCQLQKARPNLTSVSIQPSTSSVTSDEKVDYVQVDKEKTQALQSTMQEWTDVRQSTEPTKGVKSWHWNVKRNIHIYSWGQSFTYLCNLTPEAYLNCCPAFICFTFFQQATRVHTLLHLVALPSHCR